VSIYTENITLLPVRIFPTSLENELPQLDPALSPASILKEGYWYIEPAKSTRVLVEYSVYELPSTETAARIIQLYKNSWNNQNWSFEDREIWVWEGWKEQVVNPTAPVKFRPGSFCTWDPNSKVMVFSGEGQIAPFVVTIPQMDLLCLHGELSRGPYFVMIDVHASPAMIESIGKEVFSTALPLIYNATANVSEVELNISANLSANLSKEEAEILEIEKNLHKLLDLWLEGNISKEEFDEMFSIYKERLEALRASESKR
jgi:hypothetical protein